MLWLELVKTSIWAKCLMILGQKLKIPTIYNGLESQKGFEPIAYLACSTAHD